jgi:hypothetical protein
MAKLTSLLSLSGTVDNLSFYKMEGVDGTVVRHKGGAKREKILHDASFANTRRNMGEFGGRGIATRYLLQALASLRPGHGTTGTLNKLFTAVQKMDGENPWDQRSIALSRCPQLLQGLSISKRLLLDSILKNDVHGHIDRAALSASVALPPLIPGVNCLHPKANPFFRVVAVLGIMPDLFYHEGLDGYGPEERFQTVANQSRETPWQQTNATSEASTLDLVLPQGPGVESFSLLLSIALQYGKLGPGGTIEPGHKTVASKIISVA